MTRKAIVLFKSSFTGIKIFSSFPLVFFYNSESHFVIGSFLNVCNKYASQNSTVFFVLKQLNIFVFYFCVLSRK